MRFAAVEKSLQTPATWRKQTSLSAACHALTQSQ